MVDNLIWYAGDILKIILIVCGVAVLDALIRRASNSTKYRLGKRLWR